jgi:LDH2 family malate/lactate/ureidoglycolate dehydrogenase
MTSAACIDAAQLREMIQAVFLRLDVPPEDTAIIVDTLMEASLAGYHSHGVMRVPIYVDGIRAGTMRPGAEMHVRRETAVTACLDANGALGPVSARRALELALYKARTHGTGTVTVVNGNDVARLGSYLAAPARAGFIVLMMANDAGGNPAVAPWGGRRPFLSTNPIAAGLPRRGAEPVLIDLSTAMASEGQVKVRWHTGAPLPDGWLIDFDGRPTVDPARYWSVPRAAALLPLGAPGAGHKGFALGILVEALAGALSGSGCSTGTTRAIDRNGLFVLAIDPDRFAGRAVFTGLLEEFIDGVKDVPPAAGVERIHIPGEGAAMRQHAAQASGIEIDSPTRGRLRAILDELRLPGFSFL